MIKELSRSDIKDYEKDAIRSGLTFCKSTKLFGLFVNEELVAFRGIIFYKNKAVFKNSYVPVEYRGNGYFKRLYYFAIKLCLLKGIKTVEATCTSMTIGFYLSNGFEVVREYKEVTKVRNENIDK